MMPTCSLYCLLMPKILSSQTISWLKEKLRNHTEAFKEANNKVLELESQKKEWKMGVTDEVKTNLVIINHI